VQGLETEIPEDSVHPLPREGALPGAAFAPTHIPWPGTRRAEEAWLGSWDESCFALRCLPAVAAWEADRRLVSLRWLKWGLLWGRLVGCSSSLGHKFPLTALRRPSSSPENHYRWQGKLPSHWRG